jgi:hypothetical protein
MLKALGFIQSTKGREERRERQEGLEGRRKTERERERERRRFQIDNKNLPPSITVSVTFMHCGDLLPNTVSN